MDTSDIDKEIDEALAELENDDLQSQRSEEEMAISEAVVIDQDWTKFDFVEHAEKLPAIEGKFLRKFCEWFPISPQDLEGDSKIKAIAKMVFSQVRVDLTNKAYRLRRKARAQDPVKKLQRRLSLHEAKLQRMEKEKQQILQEKLKLQQDPRYIKIAEARGLPLPPSQAHSHSD